MLLRFAQNNSNKTIAQSSKQNDFSDFRLIDFLVYHCIYHMVTYNLCFYNMLLFIVYFILSIWLQCMKPESRRRHFQTKPLFSVGQCGESAEPIGNCCKIWMGTFFCLNVKFQIALIPIEMISAMKMCQTMV